MALADSHAGHQLGLLNPDAALVRVNDAGDWEEWCPELTATQRYLWSVYREIISEMRFLTGDDEVVIIHNGDLTQGDKYPDGLMANVSRADQLDIAYWNLLPLLELPNVTKLRVVTGTLSHVPDSAEARVAHRLANETGKDVAATHHSRLTFGSFLADCAHHGPHPGTRHWLRGNVALYYLRDCIYRDLAAGKQPADVYLRAHFHELVTVPHDYHYLDEYRQATLAILPSMSGFTDYARQSTRSKFELTNGLLAWSIDGHDHRLHRLVRTLDLRTEESL